VERKLQEEILKWFQTVSLNKMKSPINFKDFAANPMAGGLFFCIIAIGYLYIDNKTTLTTQIEDLQEEVVILREDYKKLNDKFIETLKNINEN
jgi:hypothetical protein